MSVSAVPVGDRTGIAPPRRTSLPAARLPSGRLTLQHSSRRRSLVREVGRRERIGGAGSTKAVRPADERREVDPAQEGRKPAEKRGGTIEPAGRSGRRKHAAGTRGDQGGRGGGQAASGLAQMSGVVRAQKRRRPGPPRLGGSSAGYGDGGRVAAIVRPFCGAGASGDPRGGSSSVPRAGR